MKKALLTAIVTLLITSCSTVQNYETLLQTWVGQSEQSLLNAWGTPNGVARANGAHLLTYAKAEGRYFVGYGYGWSRPLYCTTTFSIRDGIVIGAQFQGTECVAD